MVSIFSMKTHLKMSSSEEKMKETLGVLMKTKIMDNCEIGDKNEILLKAAELEDKFGLMSVNGRSTHLLS